ncbi:MAG: hypothetical protein JWM86_2500 [Thermoleophilia bacterium]|nr:hypothetical protein [Thermoleophilia bacterium]
MTTVSALTALRAAPKVGALQDFANDLDNMFTPPVPLPSPAVRAARTIAEIDWTADTIVIWVPGTSGHGVEPKVLEALGGVTGAPRAVAVEYQATWRLRESVPDGEAALRAVLELVAARRRRGQRVVLLGESQGAWVISSVLRDPKFARLVSRAALVAHPGMAPAHAHATAGGLDTLDARRVREFNRDGDLVTRDLGPNAAAAVEVVDAFARIEIGRALAGTIGLAFRAPSLLGGLVSSQLFRMKGTANPHAASDLLAEAVAWALRDGTSTNA